MLYGKNVVLGVTGSISAYKACDIVSRLSKLGANVDVIMTKSATEFVAPLSFETLSRNAVTCDMFAEKKVYDVSHISLAKKADIFVIAPASANIIAKVAVGIADDMLSATYLACKAKKLICPAMNTNMLEANVTTENLNLLKAEGVEVFEPATGLLACGDVGRGKLADTAEIVEKIVQMLSPKQDLDGKNVLITAGATEENIDGVRVITNHSSGKMGIALAEAAAERGAAVTLVYGNISVELPKCLAKAVNVKSTEDMLNATTLQAKTADIIIMAAAPADYKPKQTYTNKIKSKELTIEFEKTTDIAAEIGKNKGNKKLVIFSAETENLIKNATGKLAKKGADLVVANDVTMEGAGFYTDTNIATIIDKCGNETKCALMLKRELADIIFDKVIDIL
ncbi:MAG: bifunctional phosphopantothenoylcysteine decarboxylase/phosphopantothenate--cysteine ligase CoaBC [Clostridia bacterium]